MSNTSGEFVEQLQATILNGIYQTLSNTHTNLIAKITKVNETTINVKPVVNRVVNGKEVELSEFLEVPIINLLGGNSYIQMPLAVGDYCMLFVNERSIDNWYYGKDFVKPIIPRMHDYSDSVALVGLHNKNGELTIPTRIKMNGDCLQLGDYEHLGNREQEGNYIQNGNTTRTGNVNTQGNYDITGNVTVSNTTSTNILSVGGATATTSNVSNATLVFDSSSDIVIDGVSLVDFIRNHTHTDSTGGETGTPNT